MDSPGQAALVSFRPRLEPRRQSERSLARDPTSPSRCIDSPRAPIEEDLAREVHIATMEVAQLVEAGDHSGERIGRHRAEDRRGAQRRLSLLEAVTNGCCGWSRSNSSLRLASLIASPSRGSSVRGARPSWPG